MTSPSKTEIEARRMRTGEQLKVVAEHVATDAEAREFFEFWGTPTAELPEWKGPLPAAWLKGPKNN